MSDLIDREQAIDAVDIGNLHRGIVEALQNIISELPSAEKTGKWIKICRGKYMCSSCGVWYTTTDEYGNIIDGDDEMKSNNYCSNCGARMVNKDE